MTSSSVSSSGAARDRAGDGLAPMGLLVAHLRGSQAVMGEQLGRLACAHGGFAAAVSFYPSLAERLILGRPPTRGFTRWLVEGGKGALLARLERHRPASYLARSRASAAAVGLRPEQTRFVMVMDLLQNAVGLAGRFRLGPFASPAAPGRLLAARAGLAAACSTLVVWDGASADGRLRHARNFDFPGIGVWDRAPQLCFCDPEEGLRYGFVATRGADVPGVTAFNEAGLTLTAHSRFHRDVRFDGAAVVDLGHEIVRRAESLDDAEAIARERPVASTWGLAVSSARERRAFVIETTGKRVEIVHPAGANRDFLSCANRYRHPAALEGQVEASAVWAEHSDARQRRLRELVAEARPRGGMDVARLKAALADRIDPFAPERARCVGSVLTVPCNVQSVVVEPEEAAIHVSVGSAPTSNGPYVRIAWDWSAPVGARVERGDRSQRLQSEDSAALRLVGAAARMVEQRCDYRGAAAKIEEAVELSPHDPGLRFLATTAQLGNGHAVRALQHADRGLEYERGELRRGQLLLWGARAAGQTCATIRATELYRELMATRHPHLAEHREAARVEVGRRIRRPRRRPIHIDFTLLDAHYA